MKTITLVRAAVLMMLGGLAACSEQSFIDRIDTDTDVGGSLPDDTEPIADAGPDRDWQVGATVELDGSGSSDPTGGSLVVYKWELAEAPAGSVAALSDASSITPTFVADVAGSYIASLVVQNDAGIWDSTPDQVLLTVSQEPSQEPVSDAGPDQLLAHAGPTTLDGSESFDPQGLDLSYYWQVVSAPGASTAALSDDTAEQPTFSPDLAGTYTVQLTVTNSDGVSDSTPDDMVIILAETAVVPPVADAGADLNINVGTNQALDGTASYDPQNLALTYRWSIISQPAGSSDPLNSDSTSTPFFTPTHSGLYVFELGVTNSAGITDPTPDRVNVNVADVVVGEPVADAGADQSTPPLETITLDGLASYDPNGLDPLQYSWSLVSAPPASTASLVGSTSANPSFFIGFAGDYVFELTVQNSAGVWDSTPDFVQVTATPVDGFYVELSWDEDVDLDLHMLETPSSNIFDADDACFCNKTPSWGASGTADDPSLDYDIIPGYGPETTTITTPSAGSYPIKVHYYSGSPTTTATAKVYVNGALVNTFTHDLSNSGDVWNVGTLEWPAGTVTPDNSMSYTSLDWCN